MIKIQESEKIYHSCLYKNKGGSNKLFQKGDQCYLPTNSPFGNIRGTLQVALERVLKKKNKKELLLTNLIFNFKICGILDSSWTLVIQK